MAGTTLNAIAPAIYLGGNELFWMYQPGPTEATPWIGVSCTLDQLADYIGSGGSSPIVATMRQLVAALADQDVLTETFDALPADINNQYNIAWAHASKMVIDDPFVTGFLQPTLGYSSMQLAELFALALTFPA